MANWCKYIGNVNTNTHTSSDHLVMIIPEQKSEREREYNENEKKLYSHTGLTKVYQLPKPKTFLQALSGGYTSHNMIFENLHEHQKFGNDVNFDRFNYRQWFEKVGFQMIDALAHYHKVVGKAHGNVSPRTIMFRTPYEPVLLCFSASPCVRDINFCSSRLTTNLSAEPEFIDDLESLGYTLLYWLARNTLAWIGTTILTPDEIKSLKEQVKSVKDTNMSRYFECMSSYGDLAESLKRPPWLHFDSFSQNHMYDVARVERIYHWNIVDIGILVHTTRYTGHYNRPTDLLYKTYLYDLTTGEQKPFDSTIFSLARVAGGNGSGNKNKRYHTISGTHECWFAGVLGEQYRVKIDIPHQHYARILSTPASTSIISIHNEMPENYNLYGFDGNQILWHYHYVSYYDIYLHQPHAPYIMVIGSLSRPEGCNVKGDILIKMCVKTGKILDWLPCDAEGIRDCDIVYIDNCIYLKDSEGYLFQFNAHTFRQNWVIKDVGGFPVKENGKLYLYDNTRKSLVNEKTGAIIETVPLTKHHGRPIRNSPENEKTYTILSGYHKIKVIEGTDVSEEDLADTELTIPQSICEF